MARKTKDETIDFLYTGDKASKSKKNRNLPKTPVNKKNRINLDNEIIIGLTPKPEPKKKVEKKKPVKKKTQQKKKMQNKRPVQAKKQVQQRVQKPQKPKQPKKVLSPKEEKRRRIKLAIIKWTSIVLIIIALLIAFALSPFFNIQKVNVKGAKDVNNPEDKGKVTSEEVINLAQIPPEQNIFRLNDKQIIENIKNGNTYVDDVKITKQLPNVIEITIKERVTRYIIEVGNGFAYIDFSGNILEISEEKPNLPVLTGYQTTIENIVDYKNTRRLDENDLKSLDLAKLAYQACENNMIFEYITSVDISNPKDILFVLGGENKIAHLGNCSNANLRILYLKTMLQEEKGKDGEAFINGDINTLKPKPYFREKV